MANTKTSAKRARQSLKRRSRNQIIKSTTRTAVKSLLQSVQGKDLEKTKETLQNAVQALSKSASKGAIPKTRASRKISRLTRLVQKSMTAKAKS